MAERFSRKRPDDVAEIRRKHAAGFYSVNRDAIATLIDRVDALERNLIGMLTVEPQDRGHIHTLGWTESAREALGIPPEMSVAAWQSQRANVTLKEVRPEE